MQFASLAMTNRILVGIVAHRKYVKTTSRNLGFSAQYIKSEASLVVIYFFPKCNHLPGSAPIVDKYEMPLFQLKKYVPSGQTFAPSTRESKGK